MRLSTCFALLIAAAAALGGCGEEERLPPDELPPRLERAIPPLERAGYTVTPISAGGEDVPVLVAEDGDRSVVVAVAPGVGNPANQALPPSVRDPSGSGFIEAPLQTVCDRDAIVAGAAEDRRMIDRVARVSGLCGGRPR